MFRYLLLFLAIFIFPTTTEAEIGIKYPFFAIRIRYNVKKYASSISMQKGIKIFSHSRDQILIR